MDKYEETRKILEDDGWPAGLFPMPSFHHQYLPYGTRRSIVLAMKDPQWRGALRKELAGSGCQVFVANSGAELMELVGDMFCLNVFLPDLIIAECDLPGMNPWALMDLQVPCILVDGKKRQKWRFRFSGRKDARVFCPPFAVEDILTAAWCML